MLGGLKDVTFMANTMWKDGSKDLKVTIKMDDLTMSEICFPITLAVSKSACRDEYYVTKLVSLASSIR